MLNFSLGLYLITLAALQITAAAVSESDILKDRRIINGSDANIFMTRHQVSIRRRKFDSTLFGEGHFCGGSLISENVVLTAAHCLLNDSSKGTFAPDENFILVMGNLDRFENNNDTLVFDILESVKRFSAFNIATLDDDIALIVLNGSVPANHPTVKPIFLNDGPIKNNTMCQATGWGITENGDLPRVLRTVDVPIIDSEDCRAETVYNSEINDGKLCAGYLEGKRDSCTADSGGPLVCDGIQSGIVSFGQGCALPLAPGVYTDVSYYKNWILRELTRRNASLPIFASVQNSVTRLSWSIFLISFTLLLNFFYH